MPNVLRADARKIPLSDESVDCVVTSPPYYGLRHYKVDGQIGLEDSTEAYVENIVAVFREVKRVLKPHGIAWLNLGDSYAGSGGGGYKQTIGSGPPPNTEHKKYTLNKLRNEQLSQGQLLGIPWRVAFALQADGWTLRKDIIWAKASCMPESMNGWRYEGGSLRKGAWRPTSSHEHIFMLTKGMDYYADREAVMTPAKAETLARGNRAVGEGHKYQGHKWMDAEATDKKKGAGPDANLRDVWQLKSSPYGGAHYATFPLDLPLTCIKASTSLKGNCAECGRPWCRVVERKISTASRKNYGAASALAVPRHRGTIERPGGFVDAKTNTIGWRPSCDCATDKPPVPAIILDPFCGSGTTGLAARMLGRHFVGLDLNMDYCRDAVKRI